MNMQELSDDNLIWVWAYQDQFHLLDKHDAAWIAEARNHWPNDEHLRDLLRSYRLHRGTLGSALLNKSAKLREICNNCYSESPRDVLDVRRIWNECVEDWKKNYGVAAHMRV